MLQSIPSLLILGTIVAPFIGFLVLSLRALVTDRPNDRFVTRVARASYLTSALCLAGLLISLAVRPSQSYSVHYLTWFQFDHQKFSILFLIDTLSLGFLALTTILVALISEFSETYLHQEVGQGRFFLLILLATFGMNLVVTADNIGLTVVGWEFLGLSSTLLIAFFHQRITPVTNAFVAFVVYRIADLGLIFALIYSHAVFGSSEFSAFFPPIDSLLAPFRGLDLDALILGIFFLISATGKSSILPFVPWLPRAMEGPTPSSALFYGAFTVHAGPYLFLRIAPLVNASPILSGILIGVGLSSAVFSSMVGSSRSDVKTSLAYASMTQVSLIYAEIGLHWYYVAAFHTAGHMCLRTYQFLRAPSALHDFHIREHLGVKTETRPPRLVRLLPEPVVRKLYRFSFDEGGLFEAYERVFVRPFLNIGRAFSALEERGDDLLDTTASRMADGVRKYGDRTRA